MQNRDFSLRALYAALDAQRQACGISWAQATREMNGPAKHGFASSRNRASHALSPSTVTGTRTRLVAEADGVLQMLRWLDRTPESFVPRHAAANTAGARLPAVPPGHILRFDTRRIHAALDMQRAEREMTWSQVAEEIGVAASTLTHLAKGGRTAFPHVMRIVRWLSRPAADFTHASPH